MLTANVKSSSVTVGGLTSDPAFTPTKIEVTQKDASGKAVLVQTYSRTDMTGDTAVLNLNQAQAAQGVALENVLQDGMALTVAVKAIDDNGQASPEATAPETFTITSQDHIAIMAFQGATRQAGGGGGNADQEREKRDRDREARERDQREREKRTREREREQRDREARELRDRRQEERRAGTESAEALRRQIADSTRIQTDLLAEIRRQGQSGTGGGNSASPTPVNVTILETKDRSTWYTVICVLVGLIVFGVVIAAIFGWMIYKTPAVYKVGIDTGALKLQVQPSTQGPAWQITPSKVLKGIPIADTSVASTDAPKADAKDEAEWSTVGDKIVRPQLASLTTARAVPSGGSYYYNPNPTVVYNEVQTWGTQGSVTLGCHLGSRRYDYPAQTYACKPPVNVTPVCNQRGSGYVLTSSPAFGVSRDLVEYGSGFRVAANSHGSHKGGRR